MRVITIIVAVLLCSFCLSAEVPQSKLAVNALERYSAARDKLDRQLYADLTAAIKAATKAGDLEEANAIQATLDRVFGKVYTVNADGADTPRIPVKKGQLLTIRANGVWSPNTGANCGPEGTVMDGSTGPGKDVGYLAAQIPGYPNQYVRINRFWSGYVKDDGFMTLCMSGTRHPYPSGSIAVAVKIGE